MPVPPRPSKKGGLGPTNSGFVHAQYLNHPPPLPFTHTQNHNTYNNPAISSNPYLFYSFQNPPLPTSSYPYPTMKPSSSTFPQPQNHNPNLPPTAYPPLQPLHPPQSLAPPHFPIQQPTPSVLFAALSDPIKFFDGLDHTYTPEKFLAHLSARVYFQLGPQPLDQQSYLTWHSRHLSL